MGGQFHAPAPLLPVSVGWEADLDTALMREKCLMLPGIPIVQSAAGDFTEKEYVWC
jgi:hypothetical protein